YATTPARRPGAAGGFRGDARACGAARTLGLPVRGLRAAHSGYLRPSASRSSHADRRAAPLDRRDRGELRPNGAQERLEGAGGSLFLEKASRRSTYPQSYTNFDSVRILQPLSSRLVPHGGTRPSIGYRGV